MHNDFLSNLLYIINGRDKTPWANSLGLSDGTGHRLVKGQPPRFEVLRRLGIIEGINLDWLVCCRGAPYWMQRFYSDHEIAGRLKILLKDHPLSWVVFLVTDRVRNALVLRREDQFFLDDGDVIDFERAEILAGPIGSETVALLTSTSTGGLRCVETDPVTMESLLDGNLGGYRLTKPDGLLERWRPLDVRKEINIGKQKDIHAPEDETTLLAIFRGLDPDDRARLVAAAKAFEDLKRSES
jgi:hypothetical protein